MCVLFHIFHFMHHWYLWIVRKKWPPSTPPYPAYRTRMSQYKTLCVRYIAGAECPARCRRAGVWAWPTDIILHLLHTYTLDKHTFKLIYHLCSLCTHRVHSVIGKCARLAAINYSYCFAPFSPLIHWYYLFDTCRDVFTALPDKACFSVSKWRISYWVGFVGQWALVSLVGVWTRSRPCHSEIIWCGSFIYDLTWKISWIALKYGIVCGQYLIINNKNNFFSHCVKQYDELEFCIF